MENYIKNELYRLMEERRSIEHSINLRSNLLENMCKFQDEYNKEMAAIEAEIVESKLAKWTSDKSHYENTCRTMGMADNVIKMAVSDWAKKNPRPVIASVKTHKTKSDNTDNDEITNNVRWAGRNFGSWVREGKDLARTCKSYAVRAYHAGIASPDTAQALKDMGEITA